LRKLVALCRIIDTISEWTGRGLSLLLIPMCLLLVYEVIMRYGFNRPTFFAHETSLFLYGGTGMLAGAYVVLHNAHIRMDAVYGRLSPRSKAILDLITVPIFFYLCALVLWQGWEMAYRSLIVLEHTMTPWAPPLYPLKMAVPVAAFLVILQGLAKFIRDFFLAVRGRELS